MAVNSRKFHQMTSMNENWNSTFICVQQYVIISRVTATFGKEKSN